MTVKIDRAALRRAFREYEGPGFSIGFVSDSDSTIPVEGLESTIATAIVAARESFRLEGEPNEVLTTEPVTTPRGLVTFVDSCDSLEALDAWCDVVSARLEAAGWSGKVGQIRSDYTPYDKTDREVGALAAAIVLPIPPVEQRPFPRMQWHVDAATTDQVLARVADYVLDGPGAVYFRQDLTQVRVEPAQAADLLARAMTTVMPQALHQPPAAMTRITPSGAMSRAYFSTHGHLHLESYHPTSDPKTYRAKSDPRTPGGGPPTNWEADVDILTAQLRAFAPLAVNGLVRRTRSVATGWANVVTYHPPRPPANGKRAHLYTQRIETSRMPDAYGVQLLTDEHLDAAADLSRWHVEKVAEGRHLVTAPDLAAWYADPEPDPNALAQARADFGAVIVTAAELETESQHDLAGLRAVQAMMDEQSPPS